MSFDRRSLALLAGSALGLAACGFRPLYAPEQAASALRNKVAIGQVAGREGFFFREKLIERLGTAQAPDFRLIARLSSEQTGLAITQTAAVTRYNINGQANFTLLRLSDRMAVLDGQVFATAGYSATGSAFATQVAARDARERLATTLAEKLASRVLLSADEVVAQ